MQTVRNGVIHLKNSDNKEHNNMNIKKKSFILLFSVICAFASGCTQESPPADPSERSAYSSAAADVSTESKAETVSSQDSSENSITAPTEPPLYPWDSDKRKGDLVEISFRHTEEAESEYFKTDDKEMLKKLQNALDGIKIIGESDKRYNDSGIILFYTQKSNSGRLNFEHGGLLCDGVRYETEGYEELENVLKEIEEAYPEWSKKYDEWIHRMSVVEDTVQETASSDEYKKADIEKRRSMILPVLEKLEKDGYIKPGSIYDSGDTITYSYIDGASGGIMLREFDPMMN